MDDTLSRHARPQRADNSARVIFNTVDMFTLAQPAAMSFLKVSLESPVPPWSTIGVGHLATVNFSGSALVFPGRDGAPFSKGVQRTAVLGDPLKVVVPATVEAAGDSAVVLMLRPQTGLGQA
jgi:hypothetical protein